MDCFIAETALGNFMEDSKAAADLLRMGESSPDQPQPSMEEEAEVFSDEEDGLPKRMKGAGWWGVGTPLRARYKLTTRPLQ